MTALMLLLKFLHVSAAVIFLGDIVVTAVWKWLADEGGEPAVMAFAQRLVVWTDNKLLIPSIMVLAASGYANAYLMGISVWGSFPYAAAQILFFLSGVVWKLVLQPVQRRQLELSQHFRAGGPVPPEYAELTRRWLRFGLLAIALPFGALFFMVWH